MSHADERGAPDAWASALGSLLAFLGAGMAYVGTDGDETGDGVGRPVGSGTCHSDVRAGGRILSDAD